MIPSGKIYYHKKNTYHKVFQRGAIEIMSPSAVLTQLENDHLNQFWLVIVPNQTTMQPLLIISHLSTCLKLGKNLKSEFCPLVDLFSIKMSRVGLVYRFFYRIHILSLLKLYSFLIMWYFNCMEGCPPGKANWFNYLQTFRMH